jgi:peroxiredoxin
MKKKLALAVVVALALWGVLVVRAEQGNAYDFRLVGLDGSPVRLQDFRGQAVVLKFWALGCPACIRALPDLEQAAREFGAGVTILLVNVMDNPGVVRRAVDHYQINLPVLLDTDAAVARRYRVRGFPTYVFISPTGRLVEAIPGRLTAQDLTALVRRARER